MKRGVADLPGIPPDELPPERLDAWRTFLRAHAAVIARIERDLHRRGLTPLTWYDVLIELVYAPDNRLRLNELADAVALSRSGLTRLVDRLEQAGLLRREPHPHDRRGAYAVLTEAGWEAVASTRPAYLRDIAAFFASHLTDDDVQVLSAALQRVLEANRRDASSASTTP
jgi:DNA-binding MarR family transcriptional regulator